MEQIIYLKTATGTDNIPCRVKYSRKARYLRIQIAGGGTPELIVPMGCSIKYAEEFLHKKQKWVLKHLKIKTAAPKYVFYGREIEVKQSFDLFTKKHKVVLKENVLNIVSPAGSRDDIPLLYETWLKHQAKKYLPLRTKEIAALYGFNINRVTVKSQKTRWGSCSTKRNLSFNYRLIKFRKEISDYVIIHELCHLKEMNHSKRFWAHVEMYCPDYKLLKKALKM